MHWQRGKFPSEKVKIFLDGDTNRKAPTPHRKPINSGPRQTTQQTWRFGGNSGI
jgi:hypothetical protein